jgi:hypothetical protein
MWFERNALFTTLQDKCGVRQYAHQRGVATAELLHVTEDPGTIPFDDLPPDFMIKATHGCGWNIICRNGRLSSFGDGSDPVPRDLTRDEIICQCRHWLAGAHAAREWAYRGIRPRIIVEKILLPKTGEELIDYRFYTFNGVVKAINVGSPSLRRDHMNAFFYPDWSPVPLSRYTEALPSPLPEKPQSLDEMLMAAGRLGEGIGFVRVDLYETSGGIVLGEMTIYPQAGVRGTPTGCVAFNAWLGKQWKMSPLQNAAVVACNGMSLLPDAFRSIRYRALRRSAN